MSVNQATIELVKHFEGCFLKAYRCPAGKLTIGYGHTGPDVKEGMIISRDYAEALLDEDLAKFATGVDRLVTVEINENQKGALTSFSFNVGLGAFKDSTLLRNLNQGWYEHVPAQLMRWVHAGGRELAGLVKRRRAEGELFMRPVA